MRYLPNLNPKEFEKLQMVEAGALLWVKFNQHYLDLHNQGLPIMAVKFEDMIADPKKTMTKVFDFCELPHSRVKNSLKAFEQNSQAGTIFSGKLLGDVKLNKRQKRLIQGILDQHNQLQDPNIRLPGSVKI